MSWIEEIEADPDFGARYGAQNGSHAVALAAGLVDREVNLHYWTANDPAFLPGSLLDNMPSFRPAWGHWPASTELRDQMARVRAQLERPRPRGRGGALSYPNTDL